jgi:hypothetical protein
MFLLERTKKAKGIGNITAVRTETVKGLEVPSNMTSGARTFTPKLLKTGQLVQKL